MAGSGNMIEETPREDELFEEALDLIIRLQGDPSNPVARELVQRWRARGPEYEAAWAEVADIHGMAGKVLDDRRKAEQGKAAVTRRGVIIGAAGLAVLGGGALFGRDMLIRSQADYLTSTAELRSVTLPDGTVVTLGPDSAVRSRFTPERRRVELIEGMAFFEVTKNATRPFQAVVNNVTATVLGTAFDLSRDGGVVSVGVDHGLVEIAAPDAAMDGNERLAAGDWLSIDERTRAVDRGRRDAGQVASWRDGMIIADGETVAAVVARIARWQPGRVVIADPALGARRISGVFNLDRPIAALEAVIHPHGGKVRQISPWLTIISPI